MQQLPEPKVIFDAGNQGGITFDDHIASGLPSSRVRFRVTLDMLFIILTNVTNSSDYWDHLSCIDHLSDNMRFFKKCFADKITFTYCVLLSHINKGSGSIKNNTLKDMCAPLVSFVESDCADDCALAIHFTSRLCAINKHCKRAALEAAQEISEELHSSLSRTLAVTIREQSRKYILDLPARFVPLTLHRISDSRSENYCIVLFFPVVMPGQPVKGHVQSHCKWHPHHERVCVDEIHLGENTMFISVDGDNEPFEASGHNPVLAFQSSTGPSYIARVGGITFTHVEDGATFVMCKRQHVESGESDEKITWVEERHSKFDVLVLRHDPEDCSPGENEWGEMDPTGPLGWKNVYVHEEVLR
ncbi:hypothetical protein SCHPADRAFT_977829 [Schizopora paradoxa]|uniref:Uncharacterized protein n=1 Tax=Schizopora paradoxa TaxID=27342 RepID=A0A0H2RLE8_9AGAM|nr:hypothetical protein SCHPADRAFT_977829 [Schizopora paradoxa]